MPLPSHITLSEKYLPDAYPEVPQADTTPEDAPIEVDPMGVLTQICDEVSQEAFSVGDLTGYLAKKSSVITEALTGAFKFLISRDYKRPETLNAIALGRHLATRQYTALEDLEVATPIGFQGNLLNYAKHLHGPTHAHMTCLIRDVLVPAQKRFGYYISNPADANERRGFQYGAAWTLEDLEKLKAEEAQFIIPGNHISRHPLGDVFANLSEIELTAAAINHVNKEVWRDAPPGQVEAEVQKLVKISTALFDTLSGGNAQASSQFTAMLAEELRTVAKWVEWYSIMQTRLGDVTTAMRLNEKELMNS